MTSTATTPIGVRVTGRVAILAPDGSVVRLGGRQAQILLAMLVIEGGSVSAERVAEVLWGDDLSDHWRGALRGVVSKVRNTLVPLTSTDRPVSSAHGTIRLETPVTDNVSRVEELISLGERGQLDDSHIDEFRGAVTGLHHPFLIHNDSLWADGQRRRIEALASHAEQVVLDVLHRAGRPLDAIAWAEQVIARDPVNLQARETLIRLHLEADDFPSARRTFEDLERIMITEFGRETDPGLADLIRARERPRLSLVDVPVSHHHPDASQPFVGREVALDAIATAWKRVLDGSRPELVLIRGPAGIGKTRLADRALTTIGPPQRLWGRARPAGGHTWGPFADALAHVFAESAPLARLASVGFPSIGRLLPDLEPGAPPGPTDDEAPRDAALAVARQITRDIVTDPTVLVLDDLQWAGPDGLVLIESILTDTSGPLLVLATCRDVPEGVATVLTSVARHIEVTDLPLEMFNLDELDRLLRDHIPFRSFTDEEVARLHRRTGGLPYYACALVRDAGTNGIGSADDAVPESVGVWLENFLRTLTPRKRQLLEVIAVFGTRADLEAVEAIIGGGPIELADTIDALAADGLVSIGRDGSVRIPHDLTARAVLMSTGSARRAVLHRLAGDHLAARDTPAATLATHWSLAGPSRRDEALGAHLQAGSGSLDQGAWRTALAHFECVRDEAVEPGLRLAAMIGSGRALINLREHEKAREILERAIEVAAHHGDDNAMARATLLLVGRAGRGAIVDDESAQIARLRAAHERLGRRARADDDPATRILLANVERELAISLLFVEDIEVRRSMLHSALERIRSTPEASANDLAVAILGLRMANTDADGTEDRLAQLDEVLALPAAQLEAGTRIAAHLYRHEELVRTGRRDEALDDLTIARELADTSHHAYWQWAVTTWEALGSALDGSLGVAEMGFSMAASARPTVGEAIACHKVNLVTLRLFQGRGAEMLEPLQSAVHTWPHIPTWRAALALTAAESGALQLAEEMLDSFVDTDFEDLPEDTNRFFALGILAHVAATVASRAAAARLWDLLEPYRGHLVLLNVYGGGGAYWGPVEWALARLAATLGHPAERVLALWDDAVDRTRTTPVLTTRIDREAEQAEAVFNPIEAVPTDRSASTSES